MTKEELAAEIARGLIETGIEGPYDAISCSTAGDYPSLGVSQWEGGRADALLRRIGLPRYAGVSYSELASIGALDAIRDALEEHADVQRDQLADDCMMYVDRLMQIEGFDDSRAVIYAGMWCPTSHYVVGRFLERRAARHNYFHSLLDLARTFADEYAAAAGCGDYAAGYENRAWRTYEWVTSRDLSEYGVPAYGDGPYGR